MANRPDSDNLDENLFEIYDESIQRDEPLAWLIPDEDLALLDNPPEHTTRFNAAQDTDQDGTQRSRQCTDRPIFSFPTAPFSLRLTDVLLVQPNPTRIFFRVAAVVAILLIGTALPSIIERVHPARVKASPALESTKNANVRILTVMAGRDETVKDISVRYVGHFDEQLTQEIRKLNPGLNDLDHLENGQLVRIPLRAATSIN
jgi:hypothetical protein